MIKRAVWFHVRLIFSILCIFSAMTGALFPDLVMAERLTPERAYAAPDLSGPRARGVALSPDGRFVTYLKARPDNQRLTDLWMADGKGGAPRRLVDATALMDAGHRLSEEEKSRRERQGIQSSGVVDYDWDEQGRFILIPVEGDLWLYDVAAAALRRVTRTDADEIDARVSPRGGFVSYVRQDNLYVRPLAGGAERALTSDGGDVRHWAVAEFIAQEEMGRNTGYWWSPDESRIALTHVDESGVDIVPRTDVGRNGATIVRQHYPRAGRPNARVDLYIQTLADNSRIKVDLGTNADIYLARVDWAKDGRTLFVQRESRDQRRLDLLAVDPATGSSHVILREQSPHWVELTDDFRPLRNGDFLWSSERSGNRHLYLHAADGRLIRQVTKGDWPVDALVGVDEAKGLAYFSAGIASPIERRIYSISYRQPAVPVALTPAGGWSNAQFDKTGTLFAATYSDPATPPQTALYDAHGKRLRWMEENALRPGHPYWPYRDRLRQPRFGTLKAADGQTLWWSMRTPPGFEAGRRYPVIVQVYGGPAAALVKRSWASPTDQLWLEAGYILFSIDNRGTPGRSVAFKTAIDRRMGVVETQDQLAGIAWLKSQPYVDGDRIGVTGWSNGGFMTLMLLTAPDTPVAAGIAGAPPTDWRLYDTHYTERFLGMPAQNPKGYAGSDILDRIANLQPGALMLIHGMADDNVTFDNSTRLMAALQEQGTAFETMVYPGLRHRAGWSQKALLHRTRTMLDFFGRKLNPQPAP